MIDSKYVPFDLSTQSLATGHTTGSFGSFINWATGAVNTPSLLGGPVQSIWVSYQVIRTEQFERELKNGLWRQLLGELSGQNKISLDTALKVNNCYTFSRYH